MSVGASASNLQKRAHRRHDTIRLLSSLTPLPSLRVDEEHGRVPAQGLRRVRPQHRILERLERRLQKMDVEQRRVPLHRRVHAARDSRRGCTSRRPLAKLFTRDENLLVRHKLTCIHTGAGTVPPRARRPPLLRLRRCTRRRRGVPGGRPSSSSSSSSSQVGSEEGAPFARRRARDLGWARRGSPGPFPPSSRRPRSGTRRAGALATVRRAVAHGEAHEDLRVRALRDEGSGRGGTWVSSIPRAHTSGSGSESRPTSTRPPPRRAGGRVRSPRGFGFEEAGTRGGVRVLRLEDDRGGRCATLSASNRPRRSRHLGGVVRRPRPPVGARVRPAGRRRSRATRMRPSLRAPARAASRATRPARGGGGNAWRGGRRDADF